jgi:hypothetical protein
MTRLAVIYASSTGQVHRLAAAVAAGAESRGVACLRHSRLSAGSRSHVTSSGSPTDGSRVACFPRPMRKYSRGSSFAHAAVSTARSTASPGQRGQEGRVRPARGHRRRRSGAEPGAGEEEGCTEPR